MNWSIENKSKKNILPGIIITMLVLCIPEFSSCQSNNKSIKRNESLPKEIILNPNINKVIDSVYVFKNDIKKLESVQIFILKNSLLTSTSAKYYINDTLTQTANELYDGDGNCTEWNSVLHLKNSRQKYSREFDKYGNITRLKAENDDKINIINYQNDYADGRLTSIGVSSEKTGDKFEKTSFKYDSNGNLTEEWVRKSYLDAKNTYKYNQYNKVSLYKHIRNDTLNDSVVYSYNKGLLIKKVSYYLNSSNPSTVNYSYDKTKQLIAEAEEGYSQIEYKNYDTSGNWQLKEQNYSGKLNRITKRNFYSN